MMETSKAYFYRRMRGDFDHFIRGNVLDIGCGEDPVAGPNIAKVVWFDLVHGNAQTMVADGPMGDASMVDCIYDCVYSSHCIEHMRDVPSALARWAELVKPGGYLYVVAPEFMLYEHGRWPSQFNQDHKASFSIIECGRAHSTHYGIADMIAMGANAGVELVDARLEAFNYDWSKLTTLEDQTLGTACANAVFVFRKSPSPETRG